MDKTVAIAMCWLSEISLTLPHCRETAGSHRLLLHRIALGHSIALTHTQSDMPGRWRDRRSEHYIARGVGLSNSNPCCMSDFVPFRGERFFREQDFAAAPDSRRIGEVSVRSISRAGICRERTTFPLGGRCLLVIPKPASLLEQPLEIELC